MTLHVSYVDLRSTPVYNKVKHAAHTSVLCKCFLNTNSACGRDRQTLVLRWLFCLPLHLIIMGPHSGADVACSLHSEAVCRPVLISNSEEGSRADEQRTRLVFPYIPLLHD